ncbi:MAG: hypothetical protein JSU96_11830 [Acidobacteriota bacterium]|nr:MAG: hypothetical protein JSU96_11830 [Acidobacteriota bacterium]
MDGLTLRPEGAGFDGISGEGLEDQDFREMIWSTASIFRHRFPNHDFDVELPDHPVKVSSETMGLGGVLPHLFSRVVNTSSSGLLVHIRGELLPEGFSLSVRGHLREFGWTDDDFFHPVSSPEGESKNLRSHGLEFIEEFVQSCGASVQVSEEPALGTKIELHLRFS